MRFIAHTDAPVAQLDRVLDSDSKGHRFESCRVRHYNGIFASPFTNIGPVGLPVGEPPVCSSVIS